MNDSSIRNDMFNSQNNLDTLYSNVKTYLNMLISYQNCMISVNGYWQCESHKTYTAVPVIIY